MESPVSSAIIWRDEHYIMLSALAHFAYCPRRCGLIHLEQSFTENRFTLRGRAAHERADSPLVTYETGVKRMRALPLWSDTFGLIGKADVVEFYATGEIAPVEYKHGAMPKGGKAQHQTDAIQLCGQALCLEEMCQRTIPRGFVYSVQSHQRREVVFDAALREQTEEVILSVRELLMDRTSPLPAAVNDNRCPNCSLNDLCTPETVYQARQKHHLRELFIIRDLDNIA